MAGGNNKKFLYNPIKYMRTTPINVLRILPEVLHSKPNEDADDVPVDQQAGRIPDGQESGMIPVEQEPVMNPVRAHAERIVTPAGRRVRLGGRYIFDLVPENVVNANHDHVNHFEHFHPHRGVFHLNQPDDLKVLPPVWLQEWKQKAAGQRQRGILSRKIHAMWLPPSSGDRDDCTGVNLQNGLRFARYFVTPALYQTTVLRFIAMGDGIHVQRFGDPSPDVVDNLAAHEYRTPIIGIQHFIGPKRRFEWAFYSQQYKINLFKPFCYVKQPLQAGEDYWIGWHTDSFRPFPPPPNPFEPIKQTLIPRSRHALSPSSRHIESPPLNHFERKIGLYTLIIPVNSAWPSPCKHIEQNSSKSSMCPEKEWSHSNAFDN